MRATQLRRRASHGEAMVGRGLSLRPAKRRAIHGGARRRGWPIPRVFVTLEANLKTACGWRPWWPERACREPQDAGRHGATVSTAALQAANTGSIPVGAATSAWLVKSVGTALVRWGHVGQVRLRFLLLHSPGRPAGSFPYLEHNLLVIKWIGPRVGGLPFASPNPESEHPSVRRWEQTHEDERGTRIFDG